MRALFEESILFCTDKAQLFARHLKSCQLLQNRELTPGTIFTSLYGEICNQLSHAKNVALIGEWALVQEGEGRGVVQESTNLAKIAVLLIWQAPVQQ